MNEDENEEMLRRHRRVANEQKVKLCGMERSGWCKEPGLPL